MLSSMVIVKQRIFMPFIVICSWSNLRFYELNTCTNSYRDIIDKITRLTEIPIIYSCNFLNIKGIVAMSIAVISTNFNDLTILSVVVLYFWK